MAYWPIAVTVSTLPNEKRGENVLTFSDVLPCPLIILEEWMSLDLIYTVPAKTHLPEEVRKDILNLILDHFRNSKGFSKYR